VQVLQKEQHLGKVRVWNHLPYVLVDAMRREAAGTFSHIVAAMPSEGKYLELSDHGQETDVMGSKKLPATGWYMDANAPEMLTLKLLRGTSTGLSDPYSIMLSASMAKSLFGDAEPMGRIITLDDEWDPGNKMPVTVTGLYDDLPANTRFHDMQYLLSWQLLLRSKASMLQQGWRDHRIQIYAELKPDADAEKVAAWLAPLELNILKGLEGEKEELAANPQILLHPMSDWHLYSDFKEDIVDQGPVQFLRIMGIIGAFVLVLACINFMILSTARSERRAKEVGIRKAIGSLRGQLIRQFFVESYLVVLIAFI
jgi:putative ABC transport system permease protein